MRSVGIVGLGLTGGSLARDLAAAGWRVAGEDRDRSALERAMAEGVVDTPLDPGGAELLVLAVPVRSAPDWLRRAAPRIAPGTIITDLGSTKRSIMRTARELGLRDRFVGSHPVAGGHRSGWAVSRAGLFRDRAVWICPGSAADAAVAAVESVWREVGAEPARISADDHDRLLGGVSHLPQVVATALAITLDRTGIPSRRLGPGGRDMTRLAGSDVAMWTDILLDNTDMVVPALAALRETLTRAMAALSAGDEAAIRDALVAGRRWASGAGDSG